jgi:RHS repeat-associated protein
MNKNGFFNIVLVASFLLSSLGGPLAVQPISLQPKISIDIESILENISLWAEGLHVFTIEQGKTTTDNILQQETTTQFYDISPTDTPTTKPTFEQTLSPTVTDTATSEPTITFTPVLTMTLEPTFVPTTTEIITPTPSPTIQPTNAITITPEITILLLSEPDLITPGYPVSIVWQLDGWKNETIEAELKISLPENITPVISEDKSYNWNETDHTISIPSPSNAGTLTCNVSEDAKAPFVFLAELLIAKQVIVKNTLTVKENGLNIIGPEGGIATGLGDTVTVQFPENAIQGLTATNPLEVRVRIPTSKANAPYYLSGYPFEITAEQQSLEYGYAPNIISGFNQSIAISVNYSYMYLNGLNENDLTIYYYDETLNTWIALTTYVDAKYKILTAYTNHFTLFDINAQNWEAARLPSLKSYQTSNFTGAGTYSYHIEVPAGPGGFQPSLELTYNSQAVDNASGSTQASWAGMGWSLETGYIQRNMHGSMTWLEDDTYTLEMNGQSYMLLKGTDGFYHTVNESFLRIQNDTVNNIWIVWDKTGNKYIFGDPDRASYPWFSDTDPCHANYRAWKWGLSRIENIYDQEIKYTYTKTTNQGYFNGGACSGHTYFFDAAMYTQEIRYSNNHYRIYFEQGSNRLDYDGSWDQATSRVFYIKNSLNSIKIQYNPDGDINFSDPIDIRRYDLIYAGPSDPNIFPNYIWNRGGKTLTLVQITEYGLYGSGALPSTKFTYGDGMHLTQVENGYGGKVNLTYDIWSDIEAPQAQIISQMTNQQYAGPCAYNPPGYGDNGGWGGTHCAHSYEHPQDWWLYFSGRSGKGIPPGLLHPGGMYRLTVSFADTWDSVQLGLYDGQVDHLGVTYQFPTTVNETMLLPITASQGSLYLMKCSRPSGTPTCYMHIFTANWLPTRYRVIEEMITDEVTGEAYTTTYQYDEPASNDAIHSSAVANTNHYWLFSEDYSEFRGHAMTRKVEPDGKVTTTFYDQSDTRAGSTNVEIVGQEIFVDDFSGSLLDTGNWYISPGSNPSINAIRGDTAVRLPGDSNFRSISRQGYSITDNIAALMQFQSSGSANELNLGLESGSGGDYLSLGINVKADGSVYKRSCSGGTCETNTLLISNTNFKRDTWYVLMIIDDAQAFYLRIWERDNPYTSAYTSQSMAAGRTWHSIMETRNGNLWLDTYSECIIYNYKVILYDLDSDAPILLDEIARPKAAEAPHPYYTELAIYWSRILQTVNLTFGGDGSFIGQRADFQYDTGDQNGTQYGNQTRIISQYWDSYSWVPYRSTREGYYPKVIIGTLEDSRYLTGLPAYTNTYTCPGGCDWSVEDMLSSVWYLYDEHIMYYDQPDDGKLTGNRTLIFYTTPPRTGPRYADIRFGHDVWGNRTSVTQYSGDTDDYGFGSGSGTRTNETIYDSNLHTYITEERNSLYPAFPATFYYYDQTINWALGLPSRLTDPNNNTTSATYDTFGRLLTVIRPGDDNNNPTISISYHEPSSPFVNNPFWSEAKQRITGSTYFTMRKYYNGIGQMLQTQVVGATIGTSPRDILTDTFYDPGGRVFQQGVPYDVATGSNYHDRNAGVAHTEFIYDILGRPRYTWATDNSMTSYSYWDGYYNNYPYQYSMETNPRGYSTIMMSDIWGRLVLDIPPTGPAVNYGYDASDHLIIVVRGGSTTTLNYDFGGRKTSMIDPDMGTWSYTYDALGNLATQTDARGCLTSVSYDLLNRPSTKSYTGNCGTATTSVTYTYDSGTNGIGRRTGMSDGSGSTSWSYDNRGRTRQEIKAITGSGSFKTLWEYNSADLVSSITYPADAGGNSGEVVNYSYYPQMLLDSVSGTNTYVNNTDYDAAGRIELRDLGVSGSNPVIRQDYTYFDWINVNGQGRLQQIISTTNGPDSLQDLHYTYDSLGNILTIQDYKAGSPQTQTFTYDALDRLTSGVASGGSGGTYALQNYTYDSATGNLSGKAGLSYTYNTTSPSPAHGVRRSNGTGGSSKTIKIRAYSTPCNDGVRATMELWVNGSKVATWANIASNWTNYSQSATLSGKDVVDVVFTNDCFGGGYDRNLYVDYIIVDGTTIQAEGGAAILDRGDGTASFDGQNVIMGQEAINWNGALRLVKGDGAFIGGYDGNGNLTSRVVNGAAYLLAYDAESRLVSVIGGVTASFVYDGDGNRVKGTISGVITTYIANYFEWSGSTSTMKSYYYAGSTRVAMRTGSTTLNYLVADHLGSTVITTDGNGARIAEIRYFPWGKERYTSGTTPTTFRFTGQRLEGSFGLYYYNSRWFDPTIGRWIQPDTIIPLGQGVQAADRYAYVNNSPVVYNDPSGHCIICLIVLGVALVADVTYMGANAMGWIPDYIGIARAEAVMGKNGGSIEVAAGLAVQGEYSGYVDTLAGDIMPGSSGYSLAQTNDDEINALGLENLDPQNPADAIRVMEARIGTAQAACTGCSPTDLLIVAALAQNRSLDASGVAGLLEAGGGSIDWNKYFRDPKTPSQIDARIRQALTGKTYEKGFMLLKYIQDLRELYRKGWALPDGITERDLEALEALANGE